MIVGSRKCKFSTLGGITQKSTMPPTKNLLTTPKVENLHFEDGRTGQRLNTYLAFVVICKALFIVSVPPWGRPPLAPLSHVPSNISGHAMSNCQLWFVSCPSAAVKCELSNVRRMYAVLDCLRTRPVQGRWRSPYISAMSVYTVSAPVTLHSCAPDAEPNTLHEIDFRVNHSLKYCNQPAM